MSASREKRSRQDQTSQGPSEKKQNGQQESKKDRSLTAFYAVIGVLVAAAAIALVVWNSNFFQNRAAAVTINGQKYTAADVQYYYNSAMQNEYYYSMFGYSSFDYSVNPKEQVYNTETGATWHDYFLEQAVTGLTQDVALSSEAQKSGYTMSADAQASLDSAMTSLFNSWISSGYSSQNAYLAAVYGKGVNTDKYQQMISRALLAADYATTQQNSYTYDDAELNSYYAEHADDMDTFVLSQFVFQAALPTTDDDGNAIERTDEEIAAELDTLKAEVKAVAEELQACLEDGEDAEALAEEYEDDLFSSFVSEERAGSSVNSGYAEWAKASARKAGDITLAEYQGGSATTYNYCVVRFEDRFQDNSPTATVRHALIGAGSAPTDEEYAQAKATAEQLLEQWKSGEATEESFAQMVQENTADTSSAASGGLMQNVSESSGYVETFTEWALDPARKAGDTGIVQNTGSSTKGYHIMYFVSWGEPQWKLTVTSILSTEDFNTWFEGMMEGYTAENGSGLQYVGR